MRTLAIAAAALMLLTACEEPQPQVVGYRNGYFVYANQAQPAGGVEPAAFLLLSRMNQPTYQMQTPVICNRLGNQTVCN